MMKSLKDKIRESFMSSQDVQEAYTRKTPFILQDILTVVRCNDIHKCELKSLNPDYSFRGITSTGDDAKVEAIKILIQNYNEFSKYDDNHEEYDKKATEFNKQLVDFVKNTYSNVTVKDPDNWYDSTTYTVLFDSDKDFDTILDEFEAHFKVKTNFTARGGSWTAIDYITDNGVRVKVDSRPDDHSHDYSISIQ